MIQYSPKIKLDIVQSVKCSAYKHEDFVAGLRAHIKKPGEVVYTCNLSIEEAKTQRDP